MAGFFVTGTGTDVGKTIITSLLIDFLYEQNKRYFPYKPIQSGVEKKAGKWVAPDPEMYKLVYGESEKDVFCTYLLKQPSSPHLAAEAEDITIDLQAIKQNINILENKHDGIIIEGAGGLYVPINSNGYCMIDFMKDIQYPVILVGDAGLGTINHTVLSIQALKNYQIPIAGVILNRAGRLASMEADNMKMIQQLTDIPVIGTVPVIEDVKNELKNKTQRKRLTTNWNKDIFQSL